MVSLLVNSTVCIRIAIVAMEIVESILAISVARLQKWLYLYSCKYLRVSLYTGTKFSVFV